MLKVLKVLKVLPPQALSSKVNAGAFHPAAADVPFWRESVLVGLEKPDKTARP